ncbi:nucleoside-diphosphate-sugar epimerase [Alteromonadaceae bacterium 2753L.S.0a.02]|nr:nucleoside-diphosphate-sugar epimerase [Alteromonadaceae bacterium 2753L.S.0a.02]
MKNKALITGGAGYFGSLLLRKLLENNYECAIFDLNDADDRPKEVEFIQGDIRDYDAILAACKGVNVVHHNVAQVPLAKDKELFHSVNYDGTENLLRAALEARVGKVVHTSSSAIFGIPDKNPVTEETPAKPGEAYGKAKYEGELLCHTYVEKGLDVSIVRPRTIMGHGRLGIFQILFEWIYEGANVPVFGKGDNIYQFVHADDLADACILAGERLGSETYNCGAEKFGTMREVLEALCRHANTGSKVSSVPMTPTVIGMKLTSAIGLSPLGAYHSLMYGNSMYFDITKAKQQLGWQPRYSNEQMFIDSYEWYLKHRQEVLNSTTGSHHRRGVKQGVLGIVKKLL